MSPPVIGLVVGATRLVAKRRGPGASADWRRDLICPLGDSPGSRAEIAAALTDLRDALGMSGARLAVALAPPLVQVRGLTFPRLRLREVRAVVERDVARYFPGVSRAQVVAVDQVGRVVRGQMLVLVSTAPAWILDLIMESARTAGFTVTLIEPAHLGWARWAHRNRTGALVVVTGQSTEIITAIRGRLLGVRRTPMTADRIHAAVAELGATGPVLLADKDAAGDALGLKPVGSTDSALGIAAAHARWPSRLELVPPAEAAARTRRARQVARSLWGATAALLLLAIGLHRASLTRELRALQAARLAQRSAVDSAMQVREAATAADARLAALAGAVVGARRWTVVLEQVAATLPRDAYLTAFRAAGDSIVMEGVAVRAAGVFEGLHRAELLARVRPGGAIRQEMRDSGPPIERFVVAAALRP